MFTLFAACLFFAAFLLASATIGWMFLNYHDKMVAALLFEPIPQTPAVYHIRIRRPRVSARGLGVRASRQGGVMAA